MSVSVSVPVSVHMLSPGVVLEAVPHHAEPLGARQLRRRL